jgi:hypothetical protein
MPIDSGLGYDLAAESVLLYVNHEMHTHGSIAKRNDWVEHLVTKMEKLGHFLGVVASRGEESVRLDLSEEEKILVDELRVYEDLRHIFPEGQYSWVGKQQLENLNRSISQHIEGPLQREIHTKTEENVLEQHELTETLSLFKTGMSRMHNLIEAINRNIKGMH